MVSSQVTYEYPNSDSGAYFGRKIGYFRRRIICARGFRKDSYLWKDQIQSLVKIDRLNMKKSIIIWAQFRPKSQDLDDFGRFLGSISSYSVSQSSPNSGFNLSLRNCPVWNTCILRRKFRRMQLFSLGVLAWRKGKYYAGASRRNGKSPLWRKLPICCTPAKFGVVNFTTTIWKLISLKIKDPTSAHTLITLISPPQL